MLDGVLVDYFIIIQHIVLSFYWKKIDRQQHIQVFFEPFVKNINKLLLFNIYDTYLLQVMWTLYEDKLVIALVFCITRTSI
jgi:hypothetical protein